MSIFRLTSDRAVEIHAAAGGSKPPRFSINAYNGGPMIIAGYFDPVVLDLKGIRAERSVLPIMLEHAELVGQADTIQITAAGIDLAGAITGGDDAAAQRVVTHAKNGFKWQASVGVDPMRREFIDAGKSAVVNGRTISGPAIVVREGVLVETSFVAIGADPSTAADIAAKGNTMPMPPLQTTPANPAANDTLTADRQRHNDVEARFANLEWMVPENQNSAAVVELRASARAGSISLAELDAQLLRLQREDFSLARVRAARDQAPHAITVPTQAAPSQKQILEAAVLCHLGRERIAATAYGDRTTQAARDLHCTSLVDIVRAGYAMLGLHAPSSRDEMIRASFSTISLPGILSNAAGKMLLDSYNAFPSVARRIAKKLSAKDFKEKTDYRHTANATFEKVGADGQLKHGTMTETDFPYQLDTYGKIFGITRQHFINDDLGAFSRMPDQIGRGAAVALEELFWTMVLANTGSFFGSGNANYFEGSGTVLQDSSLATAVEKMLKMTDDVGKPISVIPKYLVVPPELKATGDAIYVSKTLNVGGGNTSTDGRLPGENIYFGRYEPMATPYLSNSSFSGYSALAWYLFGDPNDVAAFGIAYLNGAENPTVETAPSDFDTLGVQMRGFLDFAVCQLDPKGAVKSKGAA